MIAALGLVAALLCGSLGPGAVLPETPGWAGVEEDTWLLQ